MRWSRTNKGHVPENRSGRHQIVDRERAEGDLYSDVEEFSMDGDG